MGQWIYNILNWSCWESYFIKYTVPILNVNDTYHTFSIWYGIEMIGIVKKKNILDKIIMSIGMKALYLWVVCLHYMNILWFYENVDGFLDLINKNMLFVSYLGMLWKFNYYSLNQTKLKISMFPSSLLNVERMKGTLTICVFN